MDDSAALKAAKELQGMVGDELAAKLIRQVTDEVRKHKSTGTYSGEYKAVLVTPTSEARSEMPGGKATLATGGAADTPSRGPWWPI